MFFPYVVCKLTKEEKEIFSNYYLKEKSVFNIEGLWCRSQSEKNKNSSLWHSTKDNRRRIIYYSDNYEVKNINNEYHLVISSSCIYLSTRLPITELNEYINRIYKELKAQEFIKNGNKFTNNNFVVTINQFIRHPKDSKSIKNYKSVDIEIKSKNYTDSTYYERIWRIWERGIREKDKRGNPKYSTNIKRLRNFLPAQIEMGCGPSIEANIPPLYYMHEAYGVQNHKSGIFYFGEEDNFMINLLRYPNDKYEEFAYMIKSAINAKPTYFYKTISKMHNKGLFVGKILNHNFDRLINRLNINEQILRVYKIENYYPDIIDFDENAKSLICVGIHADRRGVQKKAREKGMPIIYIDPERFIENNKVCNYPIEGAQDNDIIFKMTADEFAKELEREFLN